MLQFFFVAKNHHVEILGRDILDGRPKSPFSGMKNPGRLHLISFQFWPRPGVSSVKILTIKTTEKTTFLLPGAKRIHTGGTTPLFGRRVALNQSINQSLISTNRWNCTKLKLESKIEFVSKSGRKRNKKTVLFVSCFNSELKSALCCCQLLDFCCLNLRGIRCRKTL